jgi:sarcosine/dimethylglycine N-methyltransferase
MDPLMNQQQRILEQYASPAGRRLYHHVMGDGSDHIHYGLYDHPETGVREALSASCRRLLDMAMTFIDPSNVSEILDLGAGAGGPAKCLLSWTRARITCVDLGAPPLQDLEDWAVKNDLAFRLRTFNGSYHELPTDWTSGFDLIWSQDAFCHAANRLSVFAEARRALRPSGVFVFSDILLSEHAPQEHAQAFTTINAVQNLGIQRDYLSDLHKAGFTKIDCEDWSSHLPLNFLRMRQQIERSRQQMIQEGVNAQLIDRFDEALEQRLKWPPGSVLQWFAFVCRQG